MSPKLPMRKKSTALIDVSPRKPERRMLSRDNSLDEDDTPVPADKTTSKKDAFNLGGLLREALITAVDFCDLSSDDEEDIVNENPALNSLVLQL